jgi:hypothetical protein
MKHSLRRSIRLGRLVKGKVCWKRKLYSIQSGNALSEAAVVSAQHCQYNNTVNIQYKITAGVGKDAMADNPRSTRCRT